MTSVQQNALPLASLLFGSCTAIMIWVIGRVVTSQRPVHGDSFEEGRLTELRAANATYCCFEPLVNEFAGFFSSGSAATVFDRHVKITRLPPWRLNEFQATKVLEGILVGVSIFGLISVTGYVVFALFLGAMTGAMFPLMAQKSIEKESERRLNQLRMRLPFAVDQISLMMEAGAGFEDCLRTVVADNSDHPLSQEFSEVLRQMSLGRPRAQALNGLRDRMSDDDVSELVFAITKGEELGTPLSDILREQANQMRLKRAQWGEKAASEAEVQMVFPGMVTMIACLLVIVAPIVLPVIVTFLEG